MGSSFGKTAGKGNYRTPPSDCFGKKSNISPEDLMKAALNLSCQSPWTKLTEDKAMNIFQRWSLTAVCLHFYYKMLRNNFWHYLVAFRLFVLLTTLSKTSSQTCCIIGRFLSPWYIQYFLKINCSFSSVE